MPGPHTAMFIDFGQMATVPTGSLYSLESDVFWTVPPMTQAFVLEKGSALGELSGLEGLGTPILQGSR